MSDTEKKQGKDADKEEKLFTQAEVNKIVAERLARKKEEETKAREQAEQESAKDREIEKLKADLAASEAKRQEEARKEELYDYAISELHKKELPEEIAGFIDRASEEAIDSAVHYFDLLFQQIILEIKAKANGINMSNVEPVISPEREQKTAASGRIDGLMRDLFGLSKKG